MTLTLKESCRLYEQHCRRRVSVPTFEEFNVVHASCLPSNDRVFANFKQIIELAYKAEGVPVTRRLPSLFTKFSNSCDTAAKLPPSVQMAVVAAPVSVLPAYVDSFKMKIRAPNCIAVSSVSSVSSPWSLEKYKELVLNSENNKLKESKGLIVHLMPPNETEKMVSLACKLTKNTWNTLRGKSDKALTMRDGSELSLSSVVLLPEDVKGFVKDYKNNVKGPFFIRFSRI